MKVHLYLIYNCTVNALSEYLNKLRLEDVLMYCCKSLIQVYKDDITMYHLSTLSMFTETVKYMQ